MRIVPRDRESKGPQPIQLATENGSLTYVPSRSPAMQAVEERALLVAPSDETVLILGETGVGKEVLARLVHENSTRRGGPFVHLNCAALPEALLESELSGHVQGASTGAGETTPGLFEIASGGTLFLDEIGGIPPGPQARLLHALQDRRIHRVGGRSPVKVDVRVVAATNRDLDLEVQAGIFRSDLYYRLSGLTLKIPPLRERPEDLVALAEHFFRRFARLYNRLDRQPPDERFMRSLQNSRWDGNVRELENVIKRLVLFGSADHALEGIVGAPVSEMKTDAGTPSRPFEAPPLALRVVTRKATERAERYAIIQALARAGWNRRRAARELQISYRSLLYKIKHHALRPGEKSDPGTRSAPGPITRTR